MLKRKIASVLDCLSNHEFPAGKLFTISVSITALNTISGVHPFAAVAVVSSYDLKPLTMTHDLDHRTRPDLDSANMNQCAKCLSQRSFSSETIVRTDTHTDSGPIALSGPLRWRSDGRRCSRGTCVSIAGRRSMVAARGRPSVRRRRRLHPRLKSDF